MDKLTVKPGRYLYLADGSILPELIEIIRFSNEFTVKDSVMHWRFAGTSLLRPIDFLAGKLIQEYPI